MDKRKQLVTTAFSLFYRHGIHAVGINEILKQAQVAKKTLYKHFSGKEALVEAVLSYRDERYVAWLQGRVELATPGIEGIMALFDAMDDWFNNRVETLDSFNGCFFINTCSEYGDPDCVPHQLCKQHKDKVKALIVSQLQQTMLSQARQAELADAVLLLKEGAIVMAQVQGDRGAAMKAKQFCKNLLRDAALSH